MGETSILVNRYVNGLEVGKLFTTRDCLPFGNRAAVDQLLSRLVKSNVVMRLARGVFTRYCPGLTKPSLEVIAQVKAAAFGRRIARHGSCLAHEFGLREQRNTTAVFSTDSSSSTFKCGDITVCFKKTGWRKMALQESKEGKALVALWHLGKHECNSEQIAKAIEGLGPVRNMRLRESATWIPAWLSTYFLQFRFNAFNRQLVAV